MDSPAVEAAQGARTYYLFHDAHGTAHMVDRFAEIPAGAKQVQKVTVPAKEGAAPPPSALSQVQAATVGRLGSWLPPVAKDALARTHLGWNAAGGVLLLVFFFIRSATFRSLMFKVVAPLVLMAVGIGGYMSYRHRHGGPALAQALSAAKHDVDAARSGYRKQDRVMQQVEADAGH